MSTPITLTPINDTYVSTLSPSSNFDTASSLTVNASSRDANSRRLTALLQFQTPAILKYKKIVSAYLKFTYTINVSSSYYPNVGYTYEFYIASLSANKSIAGITNNNLTSYGEYGTTAVTYTDSIAMSSGSSASKTLSVETVDLLKNNIYNDYFTAAVTCWGQLSASKSISSSSVSLVITYDDILPLADTPIYPLDVYLNQSDTITFRWKFNSESQLTQASYTLAYKKKSDSSYITLVTGGKELKVTVPANTFPLGEIDWSIVSTDNLGSVTPIAYGSFTVIGKPSAPNITSVLNDALTTITWNSADQSARELQLLKDGVVITSENLSSPSTQYSPKLFLKNGTYEFKIKVMNNYGYWSDWTSYIFTLSASEPTKPSLTYCVDSNNVVLEVSNISSQTYLYRIEDGVETLIAELSELTYTDKAMKFNTSVKYFARSYNKGIADSEQVSVYISVDGFTLSANGDTLKFHLSEDQFLPLGENLSVDKTLAYYDGRKLPVLESSEHISHIIDRKFFVPNSDWNVFKRILLSENPILYRDSLGNKMFCTITGQSSEYREIVGGKIVPLTLTEVFYDEAVMIDG